MSKGLKRICMNCGTRFYDLDKSPIICPSCETEFTGEEKVKSRRGRVPAADQPVKEAEKTVTESDEEDIDDIDADDDIVSLDDVEEDDDLDDDDDNLNLDDDLDDDLDDLDDDLDDDDLDDDDDDDN